MIFSQDFSTSRYGITIRLVNESDAAFIVKLRTDPRLGRYINPTKNDIETQIQWIKDYKLREAKSIEYYFVFSIEGNRVGVNRVYEIKENSFVSGSWVFSPDAPLGAAVISNIFMKELIFENTSLTKFYGDVRKKNKQVVKYHKMFSSTFTHEDDINYYFYVTKEDFYNHKNKLLSYFGINQ